MASIDKDTVLCLSISARPSNFGTKFHNALYKELGLNYLYKACAVEDIEGAIKGIRSLKIRGSAVSMPHKETVMPFLDEIDSVAKSIGAVNTIVNTDGKLTGYNTDALAVRELFSRVKSTSRTALFGSGGMAKAIASSLKEMNFQDVTVIARNEKTGKSIGSQYGFKYQNEFSGSFDFVINATPIGMVPALEKMPLTLEQLQKVKCVFDSVANPSETLLIRTARELGKEVITGFDVVVLQAIEQFRLYTGITPPAALAIKAAELARV